MKQNYLWHGNQKAYIEQIKSIVVTVLSSTTQSNYVKNLNVKINVNVKCKENHWKRTKNRFFYSIFNLLKPKNRFDILDYFIGHDKG